MIKVVLTKIKMKNRTKGIEGRCLNLPTIGRRFTMFGEADSELGSPVVVSTTEVDTLTYGEDERVVFFKTNCSYYKLEWKDEK